MTGDRLADGLRALADDGDPHADLYARRLAGPPVLDELDDPGPPAHQRREFTSYPASPPNGFGA